MSKNEEQDYYKAYLEELQEKLAMLQKSNLKIGTEVSFKKEDNTRLNDVLCSKVEELKYYEGMCKNSDASEYDDTKSVDIFLPLKRKEKDNDISSLDEMMNEESKKNEDEEEDTSVVTNLESLLKEIVNSLSDIPVTHSVIQQNESFHLYCQAVMVAYVDTDSDEDKTKHNYLIQTFRIDLKTTFIELKESILNFWDLKDRENDFTLKFIDASGEISNVRDQTELIDAFLKGKSNMKKAKFLYVVNKIKNMSEIKSIGDLKEKESSSQSSKFTIDSSTEKFFSKFMGLTIYLQNKLGKIKKKLDHGAHAQVINVQKVGIISGIITFLHFALLILLLIFTIISLLYKSPPNQTHFYSSTLKSAFSPAGLESGYMSKEKIKTDILKRIEGIAYNGHLLSSLSLVNPMRISFYRVGVNPEPCKFTNAKCYYSLYDLTTAASTADSLAYFEGSGFNAYLKFDDMIDEEYAESYYITPSSSNEDNYVSGYSSLSEYYTNILSTFAEVNQDDLFAQLITGKLGSYLGKGHDIYIDIDKVSLSVVETALDILYLDHELWDQGLRGLVITFTIYHPSSKFYYYVTLMYELSSDGSVLPTQLSVDYFLPNIYMGADGASLDVMDSLRLVISVLLIVFIVKDVISDRKEIFEKNHKANLFHVIFRIKIMNELFVIFLLWTSFAIKKIYLNETAMKYWTVSSINKWLTIPKHEFYFAYYWFVTDTAIESIMISIIVWRFFILFFKLKRIRNLAFFYYHSFIKISGFMFITIVILIAFTVFSNNLFGNNIAQFKDLASSLTNILLFSIGHYPSKISQTPEKWWLGIFFVLFFIFIIYFFLSTFVGIYLESFRITSMRKGYSFDKKNKDSELLINYFKNFSPNAKGGKNLKKNSGNKHSNSGKKST